MKISNKLTNALVVNVKKEEEKFLRLSLEKLGVKIVNLSFPEKLESISTSFIEKNWKNITRQNLSNVIFVGNTRGKVIILFENDEFQFGLLNIVEKLKLDAVYTYTIDLGEKVVLQKEWYKNGMLEEDNFDEEEERIKVNKFTLVRCLR